MIVDLVTNAAQYYTISPHIERALRFLAQDDLRKRPCGRHEISGRNFFALIQEYDTKTRENAFWEAHRKYIDVQYVVSGTELIGYSPLPRMKHLSYDKEHDLVKLEGKGNFVEMHSGDFMILGPQDAHMPGIMLDHPQTVRKIVVKVLA